MRFNLDLDKILVDILSKIPGTSINNYYDGVSEGSHFLIHACFTFLIISLPINPVWGLLSLGLAFLKEFFFDGLWKWESPHDKSNLIFRCSGALFPFITLLWK